jgi:hypothetical protein
VNKLVAKASPNAEFTLAYRVGSVASGFYDSISLDTQVEPATYPTIGTNGFDFPGRVFDFVSRQSRCGTPFNAFSAGHTYGIFQRFIAKGAHLQVIASIGHVYGIDPHDLITGPYANAALHTFCRIKNNEGIGMINGKIFGHSVQAGKPVFVKAHLVYELLKAAGPALWTQQAVEVVISQDKLKGHTAHPGNLRIIRDHFHTFCYRGTTGRMKLFLARDLHQTYSTNPGRRDIRTVAQRGNENPGLAGGLQNGGIFTGRDFKPVYS